MRKTQIYVDGIATMVEDSELINGVKYYNANMTPDTVRIQADVDDKRIIEIDALLVAIDIKKVRPLSELLINSTPEVVTILGDLNLEAKVLRDERKLLE